MVRKIEILLVVSIIAILCMTSMVFAETGTISSTEGGIGAAIHIYANEKGEERCTMNVGETLNLKTYILELPTDTQVAWKSSNANVATVNQSGKVTAKAVGNAEIQASVEKNGRLYSDTFTIIVKDVEITDIPATTQASIKIYSRTAGEESITIGIGDSFRLYVAMIEIPTDTPVTWKSNNEAVATVDGNGQVTVKAEGTATIEATVVYNGVSYKDTFDMVVKGVTIIDTPISIMASIHIYANEEGEEGCSINVGETIKLKTRILELPTDTPVGWKSSNANVATVDANGQVTAKAVGTATIEATIENGGTTYKDTYTVMVSDTNGRESDVGVNGSISIYVNKVGEESYIVDAGKTVDLKVSMVEIPTGTPVAWKCINSNVATIDGNGKVTAKVMGTTAIEATVEVKGTTYKDTFLIIVRNANTTGPDVSTGASIRIYANEIGEESYIVDAGKTVDLKVSLVEIPTDTPVTWKSFNTTVATIDENGQVTAKEVGTAAIEAMVEANGITYKDSFTIIVRNTNATGPDVNTGASIQIYANAIGEESSTLSVGQTLALKVSLVEIPTNALVTWQSDNQAVASVDANGLVTAKKEGIATISATVIDNTISYQNTYSVKVVNNRIWANASDWAIPELDKAQANNLIPIIFRGADLTGNISRLEFAHIAVVLYEKITGTSAKIEGNVVNPFTDTVDGAVVVAYNLGITNGTSATTFTPDALITREQMATMMTRALSKAGINTTIDMSKVTKFLDDAQMHDWGRNSIYYMASVEIIKGVGNNTYNVLGNATREQALLISERSAENFAK